MACVVTGCARITDTDTDTDTDTHTDTHTHITDTHTHTGTHTHRQTDTHTQTHTDTHITDTDTHTETNVHVHCVLRHNKLGPSVQSSRIAEKRCCSSGWPRFSSANAKVSVHLVVL